MKRAIISLGISLVCATCTPHAFAQDIECHPDLPEQCSVDLQKGVPTPFKGILLTHELALSLNETIETSSKAHTAEIKRLKDTHAIELRHKDEVHGVRMTAAAKREQALKDEVERLQPEFWEHPVFVSSMTILALGVAGGVAGLIANAVD